MKVIEMKAPLILIILISCIQTTFSQKNVDGIILNRYSEPVADAYIFAPQRNIHTHSDSKGRFSIEGVDVGDSLWISHIGYQSQVATVTAGENELRIILNENL